MTTEPPPGGSGEEIAGADPGQWVDRHGDDLFRYALSRLGDAATAEDVVQDTLVAALKARDTFRGVASEKGWLMGILKNKIVDHIRRQIRERAGMEEAFPETELRRVFQADGHWNAARGAAPASWGPSPVEQLSNKEFMRVLTGCLGKLPTPWAHVFRLREMEGMSAGEIQSELGITDAHFWVLMHRARLRLRECLQTNWFEGRRRA